MIRFGLNYVPSKRWYYCWNDWNRDEVAEDFQAMARLGIDHLRVMLVWPWFQPNAEWVSEAHLERMAQLLTSADEAGLGVFLCPLTGWLSGFSFLPPQVAPRDVFLSESVFAQEQDYFRAVLRVAGGHRNFLGFDLGNEINVLAPEMPVADGNAWGNRITSWLRGEMPGKWIVNGVDHHPWFTGDPFSARHLVEAYDAVAIHAWPLFTSCLKRGGLADAPSLQLSGFLTQLARHIMREAQVEKPVWIQEFGCSDLWGTPDEKAAYMRASVENAVKHGASWITWWCSHEVDRRFRFDPLEYDLGLLTTANELKPLAGVYRELIAELRSVSPNPAPLFDFGAGFAPGALRRLPPEQWLEQNLETTTWETFPRYLDFVSQLR